MPISTDRAAINGLPCDQMDGMSMPFEEKVCLLCGQGAAITFSQETYHIDCQCCGTFSVPQTLWDMLDAYYIGQSEDDCRLFSYLPCYTRQTSASGTPVELESSTWRACAQRHMSTPIAQKIRKFVELIAKRAGAYGNNADITPNVDYPWVDVSSAEAMESLLNDLQTRGYLTYRASSGRLICSLTLTGWEYLDQPATAANREGSQGTHINVSGGTIYGNTVGNVSGENAGVQYISHAIPAREAPAPIPPSGARVMSRIFLCHANEDKPQVREVYQRLKAEGFEPWLDEEDILPGQLWDQAIRRALKNADFILIFFSQNSVAKRGYVQREMKLALDTWEEVPEDQIHTIPVRLDACQIPERFSKLQWVDLFDDRGFGRILRAMRAGVEDRLPLVSRASQPSSNLILIDASLDPKDSPYEQSVDGGRKVIRPTKELLESESSDDPYR